MAAAACVLAAEGPDYSRAAIAAAPVGGVVAGQNFIPKAVELNVLGFDTVSQGGRVVDRARKLHLEFKSEDEAFPSQSVTVMFTLDPSQAVSGSKVVMPRLFFGTDEHRAYYYGSGSRVARGIIGIHLDHKDRPTDMLSDGCSGRLEFGQERKGWLDGRVVLVFANDLGYLNGRFRAKVRRL